MDLSVYDTQYDTDNVSITSTAASEVEEDKTYDVEAILSEGDFERDDGTSEIRYLIKWLNYSPHESVNSFLRRWLYSRIPGLRGSQSKISKTPVSCTHGKPRDHA
jgi:hypothetical protein